MANILWRGVPLETPLRIMMVVLMVPSTPPIDNRFYHFSNGDMSFLMHFLIFLFDIVCNDVYLTEGKRVYHFFLNYCEDLVWKNKKEHRGSED
jgi:hypothetical protein